MIKLTKGIEPNILTLNKDAYKKALLDLIAAGEKVPDSVSTKYNQDEIKDALRGECFSKCMYCESKVEHITDLHIEHIKPKAKHKFPELTFEYENLGLACPICNRGKSDIYDDAIPFINPYLDEPEEHFYVYGAFVWAKPNNPRAKLTELKIDLNRPDLLEARGERMKTIRGLINDYHSQPNPTLKAAIKKEILKEVEKDKIYSFCCKTLVNNTL